MTEGQHRAQHRNGESGAELIELALVFPMLLVVVLAIVDFGFVFQRSEVLTNSAREGARMAVMQGVSSAEVENRVLGYVQDAGGVPVTPGNPAVVVSPTTISTGGGTWPAMTVTVNYTHDYVFLPYVAGFLGGAFNQMTLQGQATMRHLSPGAGP